MCVWYDACTFGNVCAWSLCSTEQEIFLFNFMALKLMSHALAWDNYLVVLSTLSPGSMSDEVKNAMLLNALGAEGFRLVTSDPVLSNPTSSYTDLKAAATRLFSVKGSEVRAIKNLLSRRQHSDETVGSYVTELRALAQLTSLSKFVDATNNTNAEDYILWPQCLL